MGFLFEFRDSSFASKLQHLTLDRNSKFEYDLDDDYFTGLLKLNLTSIKIDMADLSEVSDELLANLVNSCKECEITEHYEIIDYNSDDDRPVYSLGVKKIAAIMRSLQHGSNLR